MSLEVSSAVLTGVAPHPPLRRFYQHEHQKRDFVRALFDRAATDYDRLENLMAFGSGSWYRRQALESAGLRAGMHVLDVAVGTGLLAREAKKIVGLAGSVIGVDPSPGMLAEAMRGVAIPLVRGRAEDLPFADETFDFLSMGYALRHVTDIGAVMARYFAALRPGGRICILELTRPTGKIGQAIMSFYVRKFVPGLSRWMRCTASWNGRTESPTDRDSDGRRLWEYYWETMEACVPPQAALTALKSAGFQDVRQMTQWGIMSIYIGVKPECWGKAK